MAIQVGQEAPDFELRSQDREPVKLSDYRGRENVVLVFIPFAFTRVCEGEMCSLRDGLHDFETADAAVLAITCDSAPVLKKWSEEQSFGFPLLSDYWPHGATARLYGVFDEMVGAATRHTFVVDKEGRVAATFSSPDLRTPRAQEEYEAALASLR